MQQSEGGLSGIDGLDLYYQRWFPDQHVKAIVGLVHGLGSHSGCFMTVVNPLVASGYGVYAFDLRGHGQSSGQRGYINNWTEFRGDFHQFWQLMVDHNPRLPCFALGHSLGALVLLDYVLHYPEALSGIVTLAPVIAAVGISPLKLAIGKILSRVWPRFTLATGLDNKAGSRNPVIVSAYAHDSLRHTKGTARLTTEFFKTRNWIQAHLPELTIPILMLHGSCDRVALPESSRIAFTRLSNSDKVYREYSGAYHDLHNDLCASEVSQDILHWLDYRTQSKIRLCQLGDRLAS